MTRPTRALGRVPFLLLLPALLACEESTIPVIPDGDPRFTAVIINLREASPDRDATVSVGNLEYTVTSYYQLGPDWRGESFRMDLYVESWADDTFVRVEQYDAVPLNDVSGTVRFTSTVTVPNCGGIDELSFFTGLYAADGDPSGWVNADWYYIDVTGASSTPC